MNISDYRGEFTLFHSALQEEQYRQHGHHPTSNDTRANLRHIFERYADLHTLAHVRDLVEKLKDASAFEIEREGLQKLCADARIHYAKREAHDTESELTRCLEAARIEWKGASIPASGVRARIVLETDAADRRELAARLFDSLRPCDDLKLACNEILNETARRLDFASYLALRRDAENLKPESLVAASQELLEQTASVYYRELARALAEYLPGVVIGEATYADALHFRRSAQFDDYFRANRAAPLYQRAMSNLGINPAGQRNNIKLEEQTTELPDAPSAAFAVNVPDDIRLSISRAAGVNHFAEAISEGARAQYFGWTSSDLSARHPEFIYAPDRATSEGHAALFRYFFLDAIWLAEHLGNLHPSQASEVARFFALVELHDLRSCAAQLQIEWTEMQNGSATEADERSQIMSEASGFHIPRGAYLWIDEEPHTGTVRLRARLFAAQMREHLRTRHGSRWWASSSARDELIDIWNTASRYSVEELAQLTGAGELTNFDPLIELITKTLSEE